MNMPRSSSFLRHTTVLFLLLAGGISMVLFSVKYQVHDLEAEQVRLIHELEDERRALHVLHAEWAHLNNPERIRQLSAEYLGMVPVRPEQIVHVDAVQALPVRQAAAEAPVDAPVDAAVKAMVEGEGTIPGEGAQ